MRTPQHWLNWRQVILDDLNLSFGAKSMALFLNTYMNDSQDMAYPSVATICGRLNISDKTATKYTTELTDAGYLVKHYRFGGSIQYIAKLPDSIVDSTKTEQTTVSESLRSSFVESTTPVSESLRTNNQENNQTNKQGNTSAKKHKYENEDMELAKWMYGLIKQLNQKYKEPPYEKWANIIRLMRDRDKHTHREMAVLFKWANNDQFWRTNILSPDKLRKKWDVLETQRINSNEKPNGIQHSVSKSTRAGDAIFGTGSQNDNLDMGQTDGELRQSLVKSVSG